MATKKPIIQAIVKGKTYNKIKQIAEKEETSISRITGELIEKGLKVYEAEHGEIIEQSFGGAKLE